MDARLTYHNVPSTSKTTPLSFGASCVLDLDGSSGANRRWRFDGGVLDDMLLELIRIRMCRCGVRINRSVL